MITIYALADEEDNIRYIGQTSQTLIRRKIQHVYSALHKKEYGHKANWIRYALARKERIAITSLEITSKNSANKREEFWIKHYRDAGCDLLNNQPVGARNYRPGYKEWSKEQKENFSQKSKAYKHNIDAKIPVLKYDLNGNFLEEYESKKEALKSIGMLSNCHGSLNKACRGQYRHLGGFIWREKTSNDYPLKIDSNIKGIHRKVKRICLDGSASQTFPQISDAANNTPNSNRANIGACCKGSR
jgi:hypothetical protein